MKKQVHPEQKQVTASCVCGETFKTYSTKGDISVGICSQCHPFYTGQQKFVDTAGRIERFMAKFGDKSYDKSKKNK